MMAGFHRWKLRNLDVPQKLLVAVIVATVGGGYAAALANLFAQHSEADGKATIRLDDIASVWKNEGPKAVLSKLQDSLGMDDVIRRYHGSGGVTQWESVLDGSMKSMIVDKMVEDEGDSPPIQKRAEALRSMLKEWARLPEAKRKAAYEDGSAVNDDGFALFDPPANANKDEYSPVVKDTIQEYCVRCHKPGGVDAEAARYPLTDYKEVSKYLSVDTGMSLKALAMTSHVHLLGFSILFAMTGFLFSMTDFPWILRFLFVPLPLAAQVTEIACWWLAKVDVVFAKMIFYLGPVVGLGLAIQIMGILLDLIFRRRESF